jgi:hypothetical protein
LGGGFQGANALPLFFIPNNFFGYWIEEEQIKNCGESGESGCMNIKGWFKPIFHFF